MPVKRIVLLIALFVNAICIYAYFSSLVTTGNRSANGFMAVFFILFLGLFDGALFIIYYVKRFSFIRAGLLIAVFPIICALLFSVIKGGSIFDEGSGGGGYLWFLMASLPLGLLFILVGLIVKLVRRFRS
jgi:hypothetical protein